MPAAPRIYLAGPDVFLPEPLRRGAELKALCAAAGAIGLFPMDNEIADGDDVPAAIRSANMAMIVSCDAVVANMSPFRGPSMDPGTAYEMGAAAALGKKVVGYTTDARSFVDRVTAMMAVARTADGVLRDAGGMAVEAFDTPLVDNLMMACGIDGLFASAEAAIAFVVARLA